MTQHNGRNSNPWLGAIAGALGGAAGSWTMLQFNKALGGTDNPRANRHRRDATPNDMDATLSDTPASIKVAENAATTIAGRQLDEREQDVGGTVVHYMFGATMGAIYGAAAEWKPATAAAAGLPFGIAVWVAADEIGLPATGLSRNPADYPALRHLSSFASHLVFGLTTEVVRRAMRGSRKSSSETRQVTH
jgi:uncharacterized membrane protein YagU involved in acid resistance